MTTLSFEFSKDVDLDTIKSIESVIDMVLADEYNIKYDDESKLYKQTIYCQICWDEIQKGLLCEECKGELDNPEFRDSIIFVYENLNDLNCLGTFENDDELAFCKKQDKAIPDNIFSKCIKI